MEENKDLNRIKVMLAEKKRTNKWLAEQLGVNFGHVKQNSSSLKCGLYRTCKN